MKEQLSNYEKKELAVIHKWKHPEKGWIGSAIQTITTPFAYAGKKLKEIPGVNIVIDTAIEKTIGGLVTLLNDAAQWTVRSEAIYGAYRDNGFTNVKSASDIHKLDLADVDKMIGWLNTKYTSGAGAEGGVLGIPGTINPVAGAAAIAVDVAAIVAWNLRCIGEYGTYCGFDMSSQAERLFALNVLAYASSPTDSSKNVAMAQLTKIAQEVAKKKPWKQLEKNAFVVIIKKIAEALGIRLTRAKLAMIIPGVSIAVGVGFNAYFTAKVCNAAYYLYRERFLAQKYGEDIIEEVVKAAATFTPNYKDAN